MKPLSKALVVLAVISLLFTVPAVFFIPNSWAVFLVFSVVFAGMAIAAED